MHRARNFGNMHGLPGLPHSRPPLGGARRAPPPPHRTQQPPPLPRPALGPQTDPMAGKSNNEHDDEEKDIVIGV